MVENIPTFVEQSVTFMVAVTSNLFASVCTNPHQSSRRTASPTPLDHPRPACITLRTTHHAAAPGHPRQYWCAVEVCKAVELHAIGKINVLLVPVQGEPSSTLCNCL